MADKSNSVLIIGFNTRPLAYSLNEAGYKVYAVDFFGDLDLYSSVEDSIIITKALNRNYKSLKEKYGKFLIQFGLQLLYKYQDIQFLIIGSGLDDDYDGRKLILDEISKTSTINANNDLNIIKRARDIEFILSYLKSQGFRIPSYCSFEKYHSNQYKMKYPFILKKKRSAGGINVFKIDNEELLSSQIKLFEKSSFILSDWMIQEYIEGIPISCTVISNSLECEIISINRQLIGKKFLFCPKEFMYCGNIVPGGLSKKIEKLISNISINLTNYLGLKGINGFDFVLKDNYPYFMECNPRIPGSIQASEFALNLNLLDLHIKSFDPKEWKNIKKKIRLATIKSYVTKLILFAPKEIDKIFLPKINNLDFIHDKPEPVKNILKEEPLCTILYEARNFSDSFNGAKEIVNKINQIIG